MYAYVYICVLTTTLIFYSHILLLITTHQLSGFCHFGLVYILVWWQSSDSPGLSFVFVTVLSVVSTWLVMRFPQVLCWFVIPHVSGFPAIVKVWDARLVFPLRVDLFVFLNLFYHLKFLHLNPRFTFIPSMTLTIGQQEEMCLFSRVGNCQF